MKWHTLVPIAVAGLIIISIWQESNFDDPRRIEHDPVTPNWAAIASWPTVQTEVVEAQPDPNRRVTVIVLDDSGSMGNDIEAAKTAVSGALAAMADNDRVAVLALNYGTVLPVRTVEDARSTLQDLLTPVASDGGTPLTQSVLDAQHILEQEAAIARGFGTFRLIVTTDGQANDDQALESVIQSLAAGTPIQITTIGIGISGDHVLRRKDLGAFVDVENVDALKDALKAAVAENTDFTAITDFGETEG